MADRVDVKLKSKDPNGDNTTTTISYINPEASNGDMKGFAQRLNALTRNTYSSSDKIETTNLDLAPGGGTLTPTFTLTQNTVSAATMKAGGSGMAFSTLEYDGDGIPYAVLPVGATWGIGIEKGTGNQYIPRFYFGSYELTTGTIKFRADATDTYKAAEVICTVTA